MDAFVLLLGIVSPHGQPFSKIVESTSDRIVGPWIVTHIVIGQGGMVDDCWQSTHGKIAASPTSSWESGGGGGECGCLSGIQSDRVNLNALVPWKNRTDVGKSVRITGT